MAGANLPSVQDEEPHDGIPMHEQPVPHADTEEAGDLSGLDIWMLSLTSSQFALVMILYALQIRFHLKTDLTLKSKIKGFPEFHHHRFNL